MIIYKTRQRRERKQKRWRQEVIKREKERKMSGMVLKEIYEIMVSGDKEKAGNKMGDKGVLIENANERESDE